MAFSPVGMGSFAHLLVQNPQFKDMAAGQLASAGFKPPSNLVDLESGLPAASADTSQVPATPDIGSLLAGQQGAGAAGMADKLQEVISGVQGVQAATAPQPTTALPNAPGAVAPSAGNASIGSGGIGALINLLAQQRQPQETVPPLGALIQGLR